MSEETDSAIKLKLVDSDWIKLQQAVKKGVLAAMKEFEQDGWPKEMKRPRRNPTTRKYANDDGW
jgi:hypothetical protein